MWRRIIYSFIVIFCIFVFPWWVPMLFALAGAFYFKQYVELVFVGIMIDAIYGTGLMSSHIPYAFTVISLLLLAIISSVKKRMIMY